MEDKTFVQAVEGLHQRVLKEITDEALCSWLILQHAGTVAHATAHIQKESTKEAVTHLLFYVLFQSLLYNAKQHQLINNKRYEELKEYLDVLNKLTKTEPF